MLAEIYPLLSGDSDVAAIVDNRIYRHGEAPEGVTAPYITWFVSGFAPQNCLDTTPFVDQQSVQINCWSDNDGSGDTGIETLAKAVRDAMESTHHMVAVPIDGQDFTTRRYQIAMIFDVWRERD